MKYRVDIDSADMAKNSLSDIIDGKDRRLINKVGAFSSLFQKENIIEGSAVTNAETQTVVKTFYYFIEKLGRSRPLAIRRKNRYGIINTTGQPA
jgi:hypothetical protein